MSLPRNWELKPRIVAALKRIGRPATAYEIASNGLGGTWQISAVKELLEEMAAYGMLTTDDRMEPFNRGQIGGYSRQVERRYYGLAKEEVEHAI